MKGRFEWIPSSSDSLLPKVGSIVPVLPVLDPLVYIEADVEDGGQEDDCYRGVVVALPVFWPWS